MRLPVVDSAPESLTAVAVAAESVSSLPIWHPQVVGLAAGSATQSPGRSRLALLTRRLQYTHSVEHAQARLRNTMTLTPTMIGKSRN
jgi:hypothetical protein